jgi:hypothetical protein
MASLADESRYEDREVGISAGQDTVHRARRRDFFSPRSAKADVWCWIPLCRNLKGALTAACLPIVVVFVVEEFFGVMKCVDSGLSVVEVRRRDPFGVASGVGTGGPAFSASLLSIP